MDKSYRHNVEYRKTNTKEFIVYHSTSHTGKKNVFMLENLMNHKALDRVYRRIIPLNQGIIWYKSSTTSIVVNKP